MNFFYDEQTILSMASRIEPGIKLKNDEITIIKIEKTRLSGGRAEVTFMAEELSRNMSRLKNKTLLINQSMVLSSDAKLVDLSIRHRKSATEEIREVCPYAIQVVSKPETESAISVSRMESAVLISLSFVNQITMIFDTEILEPLYFTFKKLELSLNKNDYKKFPL